MSKRKIIPLSRTRSDYAAFWERREIHGNVTKIQTVVKRDGYPKEAMAVRFGQSKQSLTPIRKGDYILKVFSEEGGIALSVFVIKRIMEDVDTSSYQAEVELVLRKNTEDSLDDCDSWAINKLEDTDFLWGAISASLEKVNDPDMLWSTLSNEFIERNRESLAEAKANYS